MKKFLTLIVVFLVVSAGLRAQNKGVIIKQLTVEKNPLKRFVLLDSLADCYLMDGNNDSLALAAGEQQIQLAHNYSQELELKALLLNGARWCYYVGNNADKRYKQSHDYLMELLERAKEERNPVYECKALVQLVSLGGYYGNAFPFANYAVDAEKLALSVNSDSLKVIAKIAAGHALFFKNNYTEAYNKYFEATDIANTLGDSVFKRCCYMRFADLYNELRMYPEAVQNLSLALAIDSSKSFFNKCNIIEDYNWMAMVHLNMPEQGAQMARRDDEILIRFCSLPANNIYPTWAASAKIGVFDCYVREKHFARAYNYLKNNPDARKLLSSFNQQYRIDLSQAQASYVSGDYHNADVLMHRVLKEVKNNEPQVLISADLNMDSILIKENHYTAAGYYLHDALKISEDHNIITEEIAGIYGMIGNRYFHDKNYALAYYYLNKKESYKDSINTDKNKYQFILTSIRKEKETLMNDRKRKQEAKADKNRLLYIFVAFVVVLLFAAAAWLKVLSGRKGIIKLCIILSFLLTFELLSNILDGLLGEPISNNPIYSFIIKGILGVLLGIVHTHIEKVTVGKLTQEDTGHKPETAPHGQVVNQD